MWQEARKQEKKIRGMLVDYRKRADRRKEYYEKIVSIKQFILVIFIFSTKKKIIFNFIFQRQDPTRFLQVHGSRCKIHIEVTDITDESHM
jgi:arginine/serine-rich splicing factor 16